MQKKTFFVVTRFKAAKINSFRGNSFRSIKKKKLVINWKNIKKYLKVSKYKGKIADYKQVVNYVKKVMKNYQKNLI